MVQSEKLSIVIMDKNKLMHGIFWASGAILSVFFSAIFIYAGFNNLRHGNYIILTLGFIFIPIIFICAYKGIKLIIDAIFY